MKVLKRFLALVLAAVLFVGTLPYCVTPASATYVRGLSLRPLKFDYTVYTSPVSSDSSKQSGTWDISIADTTYSMNVGHVGAYYIVDNNPNIGGDATFHYASKVVGAESKDGHTWAYGNNAIYTASVSDNVCTVSVEQSDNTYHSSNIESLVSRQPNISYDVDKYYQVSGDTGVPYVSHMMVQQDICNYLAYGLRCLWLSTYWDDSKSEDASLSTVDSWSVPTLKYIFKFNGEGNEKWTSTSHAFYLFGSTSFNIYGRDTGEPLGNISFSICPPLRDVVAVAFGQDFVDQLLPDDPSIKGTVYLDYNMRSVLKMLHDMGVLQLLHVDDDTYKQLMKTQSEVENEQAIGNLNIVGIKATNTWEAIRWTALNWDSIAKAGTLYDYLSTSSISDENKALAYAAYQHVGTYTPAGTEYLSGLSSSKYTDATALYSAYAYLCYGASHSGSFNFGSNRKGQGADKQMSCPFTLEDVSAALDRLKTFKSNFPNMQTEGSIVQAVGIWPDRYKVAVGVMCNLVDPANLQYIEVHANNTIMSILPPSWADGDETGYNVWGFAATMLVAQDLTRMSYNIINYLGPIVGQDSPSFVGLSEEIKATQQLYQCFVTVADQSLWPVWNTYAFDFRASTESDESKKMSMGQLYDWLQAHDAFSLYGEYDIDETQAFAYFFNTSTRKLSNYMTTGINLSAQFIPMRTNVYDPYTWAQSGVDTDWLLNFYLKFGYYRKALYIDTNPDAAVNFVNTGGKGTLKVATLKDLLEDKDIVLYLDENLYNVNQISDLIGMAWDRVGQDSQSSTLGAWDSFTSAVSGLWSVSMVELAKTAERNTYSTRVGSFNQGPEDNNKWNNFFMPIGGEEWMEKKEEQGAVIGDIETVAKYMYADDLLNENGVLKQEYEQVEYSYMAGFAVLSGVYRNSSLLSTLNSMYSSNNPVFVASDTAPFISETYKTAIYNWMLVRNLEAQLTVDYQSSMDMECPLYMDIFGNILTESGYVVVPAASNATLFKAKEYQPYNAGLCTTYGDGYYLPVDNTSSASKVNDMLKTCFGEQDGKWVMRNIMTVDGSVNLAKLSVGSKDSLQALADTFAYSMNSTNFYSISFWEMLITEVLRGCPIEYIDKQFEGIQTNTTYTRQGLIVADKLETLVDALSSAGQNAAIAIPNPAYMDGIEIIVFFAYKLMILAVLVIWMITIYFDATGGELSLRTGAKCVGVVLMVLALVVGVPRLFELTYYESNKYMLQDETEYLLMLNLEKQVNGEEIGISSVSVPETNTKLYLFLSDVEMPWWDLLTSVATSAGYKSLDEMYRNYEHQHPLAYSDQATTINGSVYIDTDTLFNSARVSFSSSLNTLYVTATTDTPASYYTPYYFFLQQITNEVSVWSKVNNYIAYTTKVQRGGQLRTLGYCQAFFESEDFIEEGNDFFNLYALYGVQAPREYEYLPALLPDDGTSGVSADAELMVERLRNSQWCAYGVGSERATQQRIEALNKYAQEWIANNRKMIGKVSDETFLKCFALSCAMEHNRLFNTQRADYLEIYELSNEDLLRLSIADHNDVMSSSTMSYARFVYTQGGTMAVYLAAILEVVNFISAWVKPACTLLVFLIACISIFVMKLILRRGNNSIYGYITTIALMCSVNILGSLATKASMYIPNIGFTTAVNILVLIIIQVAYIFLQVKIVSVALKDWRNVGFQRHQSAVNSFNFFGSRDRNLSRDVNTPRMSNGWEYFNNLSNRQLNRRRRA